MLKDAVEWDDVKLTDDCDCHRRDGAKARNWQTDPDCQDCRGSGMVPTEYGNSVLQLVRCFGGPK